MNFASIHLLQVAEKAVEAPVFSNVLWGVILMQSLSYRLPFFFRVLGAGAPYCLNPPGN